MICKTTHKPKIVFESAIEPSEIALMRFYVLSQGPGSCEQYAVIAHRFETFVMTN